jgi:hypothetical protein
MVLAEVGQVWETRLLQIPLLMATALTLLEQLVAQEVLVVAVAVAVEAAQVPVLAEMELFIFTIRRKCVR